MHSLFRCYCHVSFRLSNDIEYMTGSRPFFFWILCWKYISPIVMTFVFITSVIKTAGDKPSYLAYVGCLQVRAMRLQVHETGYTRLIPFQDSSSFFTTYCRFTCLSLHNCPDCFSSSWEYVWILPSVVLRFPGHDTCFLVMANIVRPCSELKCSCPKKREALSSAAWLFSPRNGRNDNVLSNAI